MKFGQLIKYSMKNIFLKYHTQHVIEKLFPEPFLKNKIGLYINSLKFYTVCLYCMPSRGLSKYFDTKLKATSLSLTLSSFKKQKEVWNQSLCLIFCMIFKEKHFSCYILLADQISLFDEFYIMRYWAICVLQLLFNQAVMS